MTPKEKLLNALLTQALADAARAMNERDYWKKKYERSRSKARIHRATTRLGPQTDKGRSVD